MGLRTIGLALGAALLLASCVSVGDGSEFSVARQGPGQAAPMPAGAVRLAGGVYQGGMQNGLPDGHGEFRFDDGRRYEGAFVGGRFEGQGRMSYPDGRLVEGSFRNDVEDQVTLSYRDGRVYEGQVRNGLPQGAGTMRMRDGGSVTGRFQAGRVEGVALQRKADGSSYHGPFVGGQPQGTGFCGGAGGASICSRSGDTDTTAQVLKREAAQRAAQELEQGRKEALAAAERASAARRAPLEGERNALRRQRERTGGPTHESNCYCVLVTACLEIVSMDDRTPAKVREMQRERQRLQCRNQYADWLRVKQDPDYSRKLADIDRALAGAQQKVAEEEAARRREQQAIEAEWARRKADEQAQARERASLLAKEQEQRKKRLEEEKNQCRADKYRSSHPCRCAAVLSQPLSKGGACEA